MQNSTPHALARIPLRWMIRETFRCGTGIIFDAAMLQQIGLSLRVTRSGAVELADVPHRLGAHEARGLAGFHVEEDSGDGGGGGWWAAPLWWAWAALRGLFGLIAAPVLGLLSAAGVPRRTARHGWLSGSARGRRVLPSRMHPVHARAQRGDGEREARERARAEIEEAHHPHALDDTKTEQHDPLYEAREELKDALSPLYDQLAAASGACPFDAVCSLACCAC